VLLERLDEVCLSDSTLKSLDKIVRARADSMAESAKL
jgi:hypothetical protein